MDRKSALNKALNDSFNSPNVDVKYKPLYDIFERLGYKCSCDMSMRHVHETCHKE